MIILQYVLNIWHLICKKILLFKKNRHAVTKLDTHLARTGHIYIYIYIYIYVCVCVCVFVLLQRTSSSVRFLYICVKTVLDYYKKQAVLLDVYVYVFKQCQIITENKQFGFRSNNLGLYNG